MMGIVRLSFSLPQPLVDRLEELMRERGYSNRSEFVRDMIRDCQVVREWQAGHEANLGTITLIYNHHLHQLSEKLVELQHQYYQAILASTHVHLDEHLCAEVLLVRAPATQIQHLADHLRQQKGVLHATLALSSTGQYLA
jgi:CopG family nickel-responsive transcriptional regulator